MYLAYPKYIGRSIVLILLLSFTITISFAQYPIGVEYKKRQDRYEGIKSSPVAGYYIELISALIMPLESSEKMPEKLRLLFYLNHESPVFITVRERDPFHNYWLDEVTPKKPWSVGFSNEFIWPSKDVLLRLEPKIKVSDLAVLVRLGKRTSSLNENIAPAIFYTSHLPNIVTGYAFAFRMNVDARLSCSIYPENENTPLFTQSFPRLPSGRPFTFMWDSSNATQGWYKLIVKGRRLSNNEDISLNVRFYHQPSVKR